MKAESVIEFLQLCKNNNIDIVIDGGWGVDALLGAQTREHNDLDIAIPHKDVARLRELLEEKCYVDILRDDTMDCNFVLVDTARNQIDGHSFTFDENWNDIFWVPY